MESRQVGVLLAAIYNGLLVGDYPLPDRQYARSVHTVVQGEKITVLDLDDFVTNH